MLSEAIASCDMRLIQMSLLEKWGDRLPLLLIEGHEYLVGSHVAELLKKETFNLYGSLKRRSIPIWHASDDILRFLISRGSLYVGTASVSLLRLSEISDFVSASLEEDARRMERRKGLPSRKKKKRRQGAAAGDVEGEKQDLGLIILALEEQYRKNQEEVVPAVAPPTMIFVNRSNTEATTNGNDPGETA